MNAEKLWTVTTTRYSEFFRRLLDRYSTDTHVRIDGEAIPSSEFATLAKSWCTNKAIMRTRDFVLYQGRKELCGFHDTPHEIWASPVILPLLQDLEREKVIRLSVGR